MPVSVTDVKAHGGLLKRQEGVARLFNIGHWGQRTELVEMRVSLCYTPLVGQPQRVRDLLRTPGGKGNFAKADLKVRRLPCIVARYAVSEIQ